MLMHRKMHRITNAVLFCCLFGFVVLFLKAPSAQQSTFEDGKPSSVVDDGWSKTDLQELEKDIVKLTIDTNNTSHEEEKENLNIWPFKFNSQNSTITGSNIVDSVNFMNEMFEVKNIDKFGSLDDVKTVLVIQVHNRPDYLRNLIESMKNTKGIEKTLLVFSHDINVAVINKMIEEITFARVYQIFYPYNMQLFPNVFPGQGENDCPEKMKKEEASKINCTNKSHPDKYGNYRVAKLTQIKHHWWWKMNYVFDGIVEKFQMNDPWVLILEEDHMLAPDALHVLDIITYNKQSFCPLCEIISLGFYLKSNSKYGSEIAKLGVHPWYSSKHNMGMALQKDTWSKIKNCSKMFCEWDDYNWDWSLMQVSAKCLPQRFKVIFTKSPRVFHIGDCGVHTHRCEAGHAVVSTKALFEAHQDLLFPNTLSVTDISRRSLKPSKENGGWGDLRDRQLCMLNTSPLLKAPRFGSVLQDLLDSKILSGLTHHNTTSNVHNGL